GHAVVASPRAVILVPLPDVALECRLGVELELMDVNILAEILLQRFEQARVLHQQSEHLVEGVRRERGARRAGLLAPDLFAVGLEDLLALDAKERDLLLREAVGHEDEALLVEGLELFGCELHRQCSSSTDHFTGEARGLPFSTV